VFHVQEDAVDVPVRRIELVGGMNVDARVGTIVFQYPADTFHGVAVESQVVDIYTVDTYILCQPVQPFHVKIMPA
jgi:hypothetical protein